MTFCANCGQQMEDGAVFCANCGAAAQGAPQESFCANCGAKIVVGSVACPNCGTPVQADMAPAKKKFALNPKVLGIAGVAVAAVLVVFIVVRLVGGLIGGGPHRDFLTYQAEFLSSRMGFLEGYAAMLEADTFSTDMTISGSVSGSGTPSELAELLEDSEIVLKMESDRELDMLYDMELVLMGSSVLTAKVEYKDGQLGFQIPELDETHYTMDLSTVLNEILSEELGIDAEIDLSALEPVELSAGEWGELIAEYGDILTSVFTKENVTKETVNDLAFDDLSSYKMSDEEEDLLSELDDGYKATVYTFTPEAEDIEAMLVELADKLEDDEKLLELINEYMGFDQLSAILGEDLAEELLLETYGTDDPVGDIEDAIADFADQLRDNAEEVAEAIEDAGFSWTLVMEGKQVRMIRLELKEDEFAAVYANSGTEKDEMTELNYVCESGYIEGVLEHVYTKDGDKSSGEWTFVGAGIVIEYEIDASKTSKLGIPYGTYELTIEDYRSVTLGLEVAEGEDGGVDHIISISPIYNAGGSDGSYEEMDLELVINLTDEGSAKAPSGQKEDITDYDEEDYVELINDMGDELIHLLEDMDDLMDLIVGSGSSSGSAGGSGSSGGTEW